MEKELKIVVLTGTIEVSYGHANVIIRDVNERLQQYIKNIERLILYSHFDIIVFSENSNYAYNYNYLIELAGKNNKQLEILSFMGSNNLIQLLGKGYGEGEILKYALDKSVYLQDDQTSFYKLTGRIFVKNINRILENNKCKNIFIKWDIKKKQIDSRFFKVQVSFYKKYIAPVIYQSDERIEWSVEEVYFSTLRGNKEIASFSEYPVITGICASLGKPYDLNFFKLNYRRLQLKLGILDIKRY